MEQDRRLVEQALDLLVYAPVGLALEARELMPKLVERGRGQVALTRLAGRVAAKRGREEIERVLDWLYPPTTLDESEGPDEGEGEDEGKGEGEVGEDGIEVDDEVQGDGGGPSPDRLGAIEDYDGLTAPEVLSRLERLSDAQLDEVLAYESSRRARVTVLNRVRQLRDRA